MYKRKEKWYSDFWYEGKRYTKGWGKINKSVAKEKEWLFRNEVASGQFEKKKKNVLFEKLVEKYLDYSKVNKRPNSYRRDVTSTNHLLLFFKGKYLSDIHPFLIERYKKERLEDAKPATVNRELACLKNMFTKAKSWILAKENPVKEVKLFKEEPKDVKPLTPEKEKELLAKFDEHPKSKHIIAIVLTALFTGMRKGEILNLLKENVDTKKRIIHITHTEDWHPKNWQVRDIPMNETLTRILKEVIGKSSKDSSYVFTNPRTGRPFTDIKTSYSKAVKKIGLEGFTFHDLRHTWCSRMCELGVAETAIQKLGGWRTKAMISRYSHPSMDYMRESLEKLDKVPLILPLGEKPDALINIDNAAK